MPRARPRSRSPAASSASSRRWGRRRPRRHTPVSAASAAAPLAPAPAPAAAVVLLDDGVRRRLRREEGELRCNGRRDPAHLLLIREGDRFMQPRGDAVQQIPRGESLELRKRAVDRRAGPPSSERMRISLRMKRGGRRRVRTASAARRVESVRRRVGSRAGFFRINSCFPGRTGREEGRRVRSLRRTEEAWRFYRTLERERERGALG